MRGLGDLRAAQNGGRKAVVYRGEPVSEAVSDLGSKLAPRVVVWASDLSCLGFRRFFRAVLCPAVECSELRHARVVVKRSRAGVD